MHKFIPKRIIYTILMLLVVFAAGTAGYVFIEKWNFIDSLFMTVISLTTVGYGETHPLDTAGRVFTILLLLSGFGILTYGVTSGISFLFEGELGGIIRREKMQKVIDEIKRHFIVCARGETGKYVIEEFIKTERPLIVVTPDKELAERLSLRDIPVIADNPAEDEVLIKARISEAVGLAAVLEEDKDNLFVVLSARALNPEIKIVAQSIEKTTVPKLKKAGADEVVLTDSIGGMRIASAMIRPTVVSFLDAMLRGTDETLRVEEASVGGNSGLIGKSVAESNIGEKTGLLIIAVICKETGKYLFNPSHTYRLQSGDTLIVIGNPGQLRSLNDLVA